MPRSSGIAAGVCLLASGLLAPGAGLSAAADDFSSADTLVREAMASSAIPGISYAIVRNGSVVHLAGFGVAGPGDQPMSVTTPVVIGSVGKSITALAIRQLVAAGDIDLGAPVSRYVPWFRLGGPEGAAADVTIQSLLDHTSGISTADGQDPRWYVPGVSPDDVVRGLAGVRADRTAGTYEYSNLNYVVLGVVVEAVSGMAYADYVRSHVFEPLDMPDSHADPAAWSDSGSAQGHRYLFGVPVPFDEPYPSGMVAAGYQVSTARDMSHFVAALTSRGVYQGVDIVSPGASTSGSDYGTDWQALTPGEAGAMIGQSGSTLSSNADILVMPTQGLGVFVLANANPTQLLGLPAGAADIARDVFRTAFGTGPGSSAITVRTAYLVIDLLLVGLALLLLVHGARARSWRRRLGAARHPRLLLGRAVLADVILPAGVLIGIPLWIGATGSTRPGDVLGGWAFVFWTLPDVAWALFVLAFGALAIGLLKGAANMGNARAAGSSSSPVDADAGQLMDSVAAGGRGAHP